MSKRVSAKENSHSAGLWDAAAWTVLVVILFAAYYGHLRGLEKEHPHTFDEGQYLWLADHIRENPDDYSTRALYAAETRAGRRFLPAE